MVPAALVKRYAKLAFFVAVFSLVLTYLGDDAFVRFRSAEKSSDLFGYVAVTTAATMKNGRVEIYAPKPESCLHSLFPHQGYKPCWYLARSPVKLIGAFSTTTTASGAQG